MIMKCGSMPQVVCGYVVNARFRKTSAKLASLIHYRTCTIFGRSLRR